MNPKSSLARLWEQRRRIAPLFLVVGLGVVADTLFGGWPREREVRYLLGPNLRAAHGARIDVASQGETLNSVRMRFDGPAPHQLVHRPTLAEGRYDVTIDLSFPDGRIMRRKRILQVPYEGVMRFRLEAEPER